jgi:ABC-type multidrug transport system ATPase subunit
MRYGLVASLRPGGDRMIRISHLTRNYGSLRAVDDLSFSVAPGEILGLVGANGAGKTTTLHCACGIIPPTSGAIWIGGVAMDRDHPGHVRSANGARAPAVRRARVRRSGLDGSR